MMSLRLVLLLLAFVSFVLAAFGVPPSPRVNLVAFGLALWVLSIIVA